MSHNTVFDKATAVVRQNEEVKRRFGDSFIPYGRDHGGHREGRNFIKHTEYTNPDDRSQRTRFRFNLEGAYGSAFVFAEVSKDISSQWRVCVHFGPGQT
jgi:import inner membrane translocase subunit TIM21